MRGSRFLLGEPVAFSPHLTGPDSCGYARPDAGELQAKARAVARQKPARLGLARIGAAWQGVGMLVRALIRPATVSTMKLSDVAVRAAKARDGKLTKIGDGNGLQLWVHPSGKKSWHLARRIDGVQRTETLGHYPAMSLREARAAAQERSAAANAGNSRNSAKTFKQIKGEWLELLERQGKAGETLARAQRMAKYAAPLDKRPAADIRAHDILPLLRPFEAKGELETVRRLRAALSQIFRFAAASGYVETDPAALLKGAVAAPQVTHRAALTDRAGFSRLLRAIDAYEGRGCVREALLFLAYTAARPGEVRLATWAEFDLDAGAWTVPAARAKMRREHRAPLSRQSVHLLHALKDTHFQDNGRGDEGRESALYLFPAFRPGRPLSENAFNTALRSMGFASGEVSAHGFRATFSTMANESGLWRPDWIERALAHVEKDDSRRPYNRADYFDERARLMQWWADQIDEMRGV